MNGLDHLPSGTKQFNKNASGRPTDRRCNKGKTKAWLGSENYIGGLFCSTSHIKLLNNIFPPIFHLEEILLSGSSDGQQQGAKVPSFSELFDKQSEGLLYPQRARYAIKCYQNEEKNRSLRD